MKKLTQVTKEQAKKLMQVYISCDKYYHEDVIIATLKALDIDFYYDTIARTIVFNVEDDAE